MKAMNKDNPKYNDCIERESQLYERKGDFRRGHWKSAFFCTLLYPYSWKYGIIVRVLKELYE